jgi:hypothetical protein
MISEERLFDLWSRESYAGYTEAHKAFARAVEREARREALEEAAKVCEQRALEHVVQYDADEARECAAAIRALKDA